MSSDDVFDHNTDAVKKILEDDREEIQGEGTNLWDDPIKSSGPFFRAMSKAEKNKIQQSGELKPTQCGDWADYPPNTVVFVFDGAQDTDAARKVAAKHAKQEVDRNGGKYYVLEWEPEDEQKVFEDKSAEKHIEGSRWEATRVIRGKTQVNVTDDDFVEYD